MSERTKDHVTSAERSPRTRLSIIGCGGMARHHLRTILAHFPETHIPVVGEPSADQWEQTAALFEEYGREVPPNLPDLDKLLAKFGSALDVAFIVTPHALHYEQAVACMEAGLDVLLEKPMVTTAAEAESLIHKRDETGRLLVVAFQGSLSPQIRAATKMIRSGELGPVLSISGTVWQGWKDFTDGTWRQQPHLSGGGFMFDTGAHLMNTVCDLAGESFAEIAAWLDQRNCDVDILGAVMGRLESGALVTLNACGDAFPSCSSEIRVITPNGMLRAGMWGEFLEVQTNEEDGWQKVDVPQSRGVWEQFLAVRDGRIANPSPPEIGLRMARLWDCIRSSAAQGGAVVRCL